MRFDSEIQMPERIKNLPRDFRDFPVPWFVQWVDGKPQFPIMDGEKLVRAVKHSLCWVCGEPLGKYRVFVVGPMCAVNRTSSEPPSHHDCAEFAVKACPFLVNRNMKRIENSLTKQGDSAGLMIKRNPGVALLWTVKSQGMNPGYRKFRDHRGGVLFNIGEPVSVTAWAGGEKTTDGQIIGESVNSGLPLLEQQCETDRDRTELKNYTAKMWALFKQHGIEVRDEI